MHHLLIEEARRRITGASWSTLQRFRMARTVLDAIRINNAWQTMLPSHLRGIAYVVEKNTKQEVFDAFAARVNEIIKTHLNNDQISEEEKKFFAMNTIRTCRGHLPGTVHALELYLYGQTNPFVKIPPENHSQSSKENDKNSTTG